MQSTLNESEPDAWHEIAPLLDEALGCLGEKEQDAVVLRFFEGKELSRVGAAMGIREDAARMRVNRGLEKLRKFFINKGVTLSTAAIAGAVAAGAVRGGWDGVVASSDASNIATTSNCRPSWMSRTAAMSQRADSTGISTSGQKLGCGETAAITTRRSQSRKPNSGRIRKQWV